jgi:hypothetical protein
VEIPESGVIASPEIESPEGGGGGEGGGSTGPGPGGGGGGGGVANGANVTIDGVNVNIYASPDPSSWPRTTTITSGDVFANFQFSKKDGGGRWPDVVPPGWAGPLQYTIWLFMRVNNQWCASGIVQAWYGRVNPSDISIACQNQIARNWVYGAQWGPMMRRQPRVGEEIGFMVTAGNQRFQNDRIVQERSNIVFCNMPNCGTNTLTITRST